MRRSVLRVLQRPVCVLAAALRAHHDHWHRYPRDAGGRSAKRLDLPALQHGARPERVELRLQELKRGQTRTGQSG